MEYENLQEVIVQMEQRNKKYLDQLLDTRHKLVKSDETVKNQERALKITKETLEIYERENKALKELVKLWA